jgi:hypothetical protein
LIKNAASLFCRATSLLAVSTLLSAQQPAPSNKQNATMTAEQANDANIQLMRQDVRAERKNCGREYAVNRNGSDQVLANLR